MLKIFKLILAPILSLILLIIGNSLFTTYTSIRLKLEGHSISLIGFTTAVYFAGLLFGSLKSTRFIERVGHIRAYATLAALIAVLAMLKAIFLQGWTWIIIRFLVGFFIAGLFVTIESWLLSKSTTENKGKVLSIYMISYYASQGIGQLLLSASNPMTLLPFAIIVIFSAISIVPICMTKISAPIIQERSYLKIKQLFKIAPLGVIGAILSGSICGPIYGLIPIYVKDIGMPISKIAYAMGMTLIGGLILQWPIGHLSDLVDRRKVLFIVSFAVSIVAFLIILNSIYSYVPIIFLLTLLGGVSFAIYPLTVTHTTDTVDSKDTISAIAVLTLLYSIGAIIGPIAAAYSMKILGEKGLFIYISFVGIFFGIYTIYRTFKIIDIPKEEKVSYRNVPGTTPLVTELDPRTKEKEEEEEKENKSE